VRARPTTLTEVAVGDDAAAWSSIGFTVGEGGVCRVGAVDVRLVGAGGPRRGIVGWRLAGTASGGALDGLPAAGPPAGAGTGAAGEAGPGPAPHPNGATVLDHVVVITPDLERTTAAIEAEGIGARRTREAGRGRRQRFFRLGEVILELVGPAEPAGDGPARLWGLAFTVADIDATADHLAGRISAPKPAVQPGRRIATLRAGDAVSVPVAFLSAGPDPPGGELGPHR
jgi:hypothetical protein